MPGIEDLATRGDLLDQALPVELPPIPSSVRRTEAEMPAAFERVRAPVFGALLDAVVGGLRRLPNLQVEQLPRLADFDRWVMAAEPGVGLPSGNIARAIDEVARRGAHTALDADPVGEAILTRSTTTSADPNGVLPALLKRSNGVRGYALDSTGGCPAEVIRVP